MKNRYHTTAAYVSGAIVGRMWMPDVVAGIAHQFNVRDRIARFSDPSGATFRDILLSELTERGGDFQDARFSADTVIRVERRRVDGPGNYTVHVWEREVASLPDCDDLVHPDTFAGDFFGDE